MNDPHLFLGPLASFTTVALIVAVAWNFARGGNRTVTALIIVGVILGGCSALMPMPDIFSEILDAASTLSTLVGLFIASLDYKNIKRNEI